MVEPRLLAGRYKMEQAVAETPVEWSARDVHRDGRSIVVSLVDTGLTGAAAEAASSRAGRNATDAVRALGPLGEKTIVAPTDAVIDDGELWVVRDTATGTPLDERELDERSLARVGADVAGALVAAHGAGVVHGNVRAGAVLVREDGATVAGALSGFAITAPRDVAPDAPTAAHPEPERVSGRPTAPPADVYALGTVLTEAMARTGVEPSERMSTVLRSMRAEHSDVRPTAWAAQQRLETIAGGEPAAPAPAGADVTRVTADADNAATSVVPAGMGAAAMGAAAGGMGAAMGAAHGGSDPRGSFPQGSDPGRSWSTQGDATRAGASPAGQWWPQNGPSDPFAHGSQGPAGPGGLPPGPGGSGPQAMPKPSDGKRWLAVAGAVLAVVAVIAGILLVARPVQPVGGVAAAPAGVTPAPPSLLGDVRTADPCSLQDPAALGAYGQAQVLPQYGIVTGCTVQVNTGGSGFVFVLTAFQTDSVATPSGTPAKVGDLTTYRGTEYQRDCQHTIVLPDRSRVIIDVAASTDSQAGVCTIADTALDRAAALIAARKIGHRDLDIPATSVLNAKACDLLDISALSTVPSLRDRRESGFNDWACRFGVDPAYPTGARVFVSFRDSNSLSSATSQITVAGRSAGLFPDAGPSCELWLAQRGFTAPSGDQRLEIVSIYVYLATDQAGATPDLACQKATELAQAASPKLPPTQ